MSDVRFRLNPNVHSVEEIRRELQRLQFQGAHILPYYSDDLSCIVHAGILLPATLANADAPNNSIFYSSTDGVLVYKDSGGDVDSLEEEGGGGNEEQTQTLLMDEAKAGDQGTVVVQNCASGSGHDQRYRFWIYNGTDDDGDEFEQGFDLAAGEYEMNVLGVEGSNRCILDWYIADEGGAFVQVKNNDDWYNAAGYNYNQVHTWTVTIAADGYHVLKGIVDGKNPSSSHHYYAITKVWFVPDDGDWSP